MYQEKLFFKHLLCIKFWVYIVILLFVLTLSNHQGKLSDLIKVVFNKKWNTLFYVLKVYLFLLLSVKIALENCHIFQPWILTTKSQKGKFRTPVTFNLTIFAAHSYMLLTFFNQYLHYIPTVFMFDYRNVDFNLD